MSKYCTPGDYSDSTSLNGTYKVEQASPYWSGLPRFENLIRTSLNWEKNLPLAETLSLSHEKEKLKIELKLQNPESFGGQLYKDGKVCFHGPVKIDVQG